MQTHTLRVSPDRRPHLRRLRRDRCGRDRPGRGRAADPGRGQPRRRPTLPARRPTASRTRSPLLVFLNLEGLVRARRAGGPGRGPGLRDVRGEICDASTALGLAVSDVRHVLATDASLLIGDRPRRQRPRLDVDPATSSRPSNLAPMTSSSLAKTSTCSPRSRSPRATRTRSPTRSPTASSTPSWRDGPRPVASPARRWSTPASSSSRARSRPRPTSTSPRSPARRSARSATTDADARLPADTCAVINAIDKQSPDIAQGVDKALEARARAAPTTSSTSPAPATRG